MEKPFIQQIEFPEGVFDFIGCEIAIFEEDDNGQRNITTTFETLIAVGLPGIDIPDNASKELQFFDERKVFAYAQDLDEFQEWYEKGGWDFIILDYEKELIFNEK